MDLIATKASLRAVLPREVLTSGMSEAVRCTVQFDEAWDGLSKIAVFSNGYTVRDVPEADWDGNTFSIPAEVTALSGATVRLGIYGTDGDTTVLPTVWCSLGRVQPGADPSGDEALAADSPIWAQVLARQEEIEAAAGRTLLPYTTLTRNGHEGTVTVHLHGLVEGERYALHLYTAKRRNGRQQKAWRHTPNYDFDDQNSNISRKGYGRLAGRNFACEGGADQYPAVPDWMPNGGYLQTEWTLDGETTELRIGLKGWLLPLLKPLDPAAEDPWAECGMIGLGRSDKASLLMRFCLVRLTDGAVGECRDVLKIGVPNLSSNEVFTLGDGGRINSLYTAIV